jgi:hypothetical protein
MVLTIVGSERESDTERERERAATYPWGEGAVKVRQNRLNPIRAAHVKRYRGRLGVTSSGHAPWTALEGPHSINCRRVHTKYETNN